MALTARAFPREGGILVVLWACRGVPTYKALVAACPCPLLQRVLIVFAPVCHRDHGPEFYPYLSICQKAAGGPYRRVCSYCIRPFLAECDRYWRRFQTIWLCMSRKAVPRDVIEEYFGLSGLLASAAFSDRRHA
jgi:hypothetical protein